MTRALSTATNSRPNARLSLLISAIAPGSPAMKSNHENVIKKLQNYSPRLGTVIFEAFSLRKRNSMRYATRQQFQEMKKKKNVQYCFNVDKT